MAGAQRALDATASLTITDPNSEVASVQFMTGPVGAASRGPFAATRVSGNTFEFDTDLDVQSLTRVTPVVTLNTGQTLKAPSAVFGVELEPIDAPPGTLATATVTPGTRTLTLAVSLGTAARWRCYASRGVSPTDGDMARGSLSRQYLRVESDVSAASLVMSASAGLWNCVVLGYNAAGQAGPRTVVAVQVAA